MAWTRKLASGKHQGQYRDPHNRTRSAGVFKRKGDAQRAADEASAAVKLGVWIQKPKGSETVAKFADEWLRRVQDRREPNTYVDYETQVRLYIRPHLGSFPLAALGRTDVQGFVDRLKRDGRSVAKIKKVLRVLHAMLQEALHEEKVDRNAASAIDPGHTLPIREKVVLRPEELVTLAGSIEPQWSALVLTSGILGLRWSECAGLHVADLDLSNGWAYIRHSKPEVKGRLHDSDRKNHRPVRVPLPPFLSRILDAHIARFPSKDGLVFTSPKGGPLRRNVYARKFKPAVLRAGLDPRGWFHDLRAVAGSVSYSGTYAGAGGKVTQKLLGHSSEQVTTEIYAHVYPEDLEQLRGSLERIYVGVLEASPLAAHLLHEDDAKVKALGARKSKKAV